MFKSTLLLSIVYIALISCSKKEHELSCHWVSKEYFEGKDFWTIDFESIKDVSQSGRDSTIYYIVCNKNSLSSEEELKMVLSKSKAEGFEFFPPVDDAPITRLTFNKDTLFVKGGHFLVGAFVRIKEPESFYRELFNKTSLEVNLPNHNHDDTIFSIKKYFATNLVIGKSKVDPLSFDSIRTNIWGGSYLKLEDISVVISRGRDNLPINERNNFTILLNADSLVKDGFIQKIIGQINAADSAIRIYRSTFDYMNNKVYYRPIKNTTHLLIH